MVRVRGRWRARRREQRWDGHLIRIELVLMRPHRGAAFQHPRAAHPAHVALRAAPQALPDAPQRSLPHGRVRVDSVRLQLCCREPERAAQRRVCSGALVRKKARGEVRRVGQRPPHKARQRPHRHRKQHHEAKSRGRERGEVKSARSVRQPIANTTS